MTSQLLAELRIPISVQPQPKSSNGLRLLFLNLITLPIQLLLCLPLILIGNDSASQTSGWMMLLVSECLVLVVLAYVLSARRTMPRITQPWELVLTPYQLALQNGALPASLLESVSYRPKNFFQDDALILNYAEAGNQASSLLLLDQPESVYRDLCERINAFLAGHRAEIAAAAREPLAQAAPHLTLPRGCRMQLTQHRDQLAIHFVDLEGPEHYAQTVLANPESMHSQGRVHLRLSPECLELELDRHQTQIAWQDLQAVRIERVREPVYGVSSNRTIYKTFYVMNLHWPAHSLQVAKVHETAGLRHQLAWLQDLICRQQNEALQADARD